MEILRTDSPRWREFTERLYQEIGDDGCIGEHTPTIKVLEKMDGVDVDATLEHLCDRGGQCACTILLDVGPVRLPAVERW
jgi:hypothetical protein